VLLPQGSLLAAGPQHKEQQMMAKEELLLAQDWLPIQRVREGRPTLRRLLEQGLLLAPVELLI
jgi:hypothetical protein